MLESLKSLRAEDPANFLTEVESLCVRCEETGVTRLLLTRIPFYRDVIVMSFSCEHCGYANNEIESAEKVQEQGIRYVVKISDKKDLNRQVVKSKYAAVSIPEVDFEIPSGSQIGEVTTVEGIIRRAIEALERSQCYRKETNSAQADKIDAFLIKFANLLKLDEAFTIILDDPSGDSFVENPHPYQIDPKAKVIHYYRSLQQDKLLSLVPDDAEVLDTEEAPPIWESKEALRNEVLHFTVPCASCKAPAETNMKLTNIPYFKEVVIMATNCDSCGARTSEVKSGSGVSEKGVRLILLIENEHDLTRDVLKSETCHMSIPELDMEVGMGILGGRFTTVEGLLTSIKHELIEQGGFALGDSAEETKKLTMTEFLARLDDVISLRVKAHLILDDPAGNSYIQSFAAPQADNQLLIEYYERNFDQNEELGLNDMKTENYDTVASSS